jgi:hypothetical protein
MSSTSAPPCWHRSQKRETDLPFIGCSTARCCAPNHPRGGRGRGGDWRPSAPRMYLLEGLAFVGARARRDVQATGDEHLICVNEARGAILFTNHGADAYGHTDDGLEGARRRANACAHVRGVEVELRRLG